jgi:hypothetical protein
VGVITAFKRRISVFEKTKSKPAKKFKKGKKVEPLTSSSTDESNSED